MLLSTWQRYELEMKQTRQFGYLAENRLVVWRSFVWLFGERLMKILVLLAGSRHGKIFPLILIFESRHQ
jgi:hypothetical protein